MVLINFFLIKIINLSYINFNSQDKTFLLLLFLIILITNFFLPSFYQKSRVISLLQSC